MAKTYGDYDVYEDIFPRQPGRPFSPVRIGVDPRSGRIVMGFDHVLVCMARLFTTRFHSRPMRRWAGSFAPHLIGRNGTTQTITKFWWSIGTAVDLWEPGFDIRQIYVRQPARAEDIGFQTTVDDLRMGRVKFQMDGYYIPRGHLGDKTPDGLYTVQVTGSGNSRWRVEQL